MHFPFPPDTVHFNPRFREGSDFVCRGKSGGLGDFNPRSREGGDSSALCQLSSLYISIHAPAKGATTVIPDAAINCWNFNPRSREGSDLVIIRSD